MKQYRSPNYYLPYENGANSAFPLLVFCQHFRTETEFCFGFKWLPAVIESNLWLTFLVVQVNESSISSFRIALSL